MITVAEAATRLGISVSSIRHYEKQFGLCFARTQAGQRVLSERDLENLRIIRSFRSQHVPLDEIRKQLALSDGQIEESRPSVEEVLAALIARQDELERQVKSQQALLQHLTSENQRLVLAQDQVKLLLEAPKEPDPVIGLLAEQVAVLETRQERGLHDLETRLQSLLAEVKALPDGPAASLDAALTRFGALEDELKARAQSAGDPPAIALLRDQLQALQGTIASKSRTADGDPIRGLQRRMLELEAAVATREEPLGRDEDGLLDTLVEAIREDVRSRRPWWRFWA